MDNEEIKKVFTLAYEDDGEIDTLVDALDEYREDFSDYADFWTDAAKLLEKWGIEDNAELLGALCSILRADSREELVTLAQTFRIPEAIQEDAAWKEELFICIQRYIKNYNTDIDNSLIPRKKPMSIIAKMLAVSFDAFGYGICHDGIRIIMRTFNNDVLEGLVPAWYQDGIEYDPDDFPYYDGSEREDVFEDFFEQHSMEELLAED